MSDGGGGDGGGGGGDSGGDGGGGGIDLDFAGDMAEVFGSTRGRIFLRVLCAIGCFLLIWWVLA